MLRSAVLASHHALTTDMYVNFLGRETSRDDNFQARRLHLHAVFAKTWRNLNPAAFELVHNGRFEAE